MRSASLQGRYLVCCRLQCHEDGQEYEVVYHGSSTLHRLQGLQAGTNYRLRVQAVNAVGKGSWSKEAGFTTTRLPPQPPAGLECMVDADPLQRCSSAPGPATEVVSVACPDILHTSGVRKHELQFGHQGFESVVRKVDTHNCCHHSCTCPSFLEVMCCLCSHFRTCKSGERFTSKTPACCCWLAMPQACREICRALLCIASRLWQAKVCCPLWPFVALWVSTHPKNHNHATKNMQEGAKSSCLQFLCTQMDGLLQSPGNGLYHT